MGQRAPTYPGREVPPHRHVEEREEEAVDELVEDVHGVVLVDIQRQWDAWG